MSWKPIDFQGVITIQQTLFRLLEEDLNEKEAQLAIQLQNIGQFPPERPSLSAPLSIESSQLKLSSAVEAFSKKIHALSDKKNTQPTVDQKITIIDHINSSLWEYVEVLEGSVIELFQQLKQVEIGQWNETLQKTLESLKEQLLHRIEDLSWTIRRLKLPLKEYRWNYHTKSSFWSHLKQGLFFFSNPIDSNLLINLNHTEKFLKSHYRDFMDRYNQYVRLVHQLSAYITKQEGFIVLPSLEKDDQVSFEQICRWLKLRELDAREKGKLAQQIISILKNGIGIHQAIKLFKTYLNRIEKSLYTISKELKTVPMIEREAYDTLKGRVDLIIGELGNLQNVIASYREFLLKTDSNPYIRSRLGFTEWIVGPEPLKTRNLMQQVYDCKELTTRFTALSKTFGDDESIRISDSYDKIEKLLHEMSSPLTSQLMMKQKGEFLLDCLNKCDILGSLHFEMVAYVGMVLNKAMRLDWKYHVLHEFPLFHHIFDEYQGLISSELDPVHHARLEKLQGHFSHIEDWVRNEDIDAHVNEISIDMNDMKTYLQDFLASIQRIIKDKSLASDQSEKLIKKFQHQLLEYRYLFGDFFMNLLRLDESTGTRVRNKFLFVDQYFETIDLLLTQVSSGT